MINLINSFIDFLYPKTSLISGERIEPGNSNDFITDNEFNSLRRITPEDLKELNAKIVSDYSFSSIAFYENDDFSKLIYMLKYGGMKNLGTFLGETTGMELRIHLEENNIQDFDYIIPVPLFKTKIRERGYNQSDYICRGLNRIIAAEFVPDLVKRIRHTTTQTKLSRDERINNIRDAFEINKKYTGEISGKRVIIADDVITTGSTMNEVINVLKKNNAGEILAFSVAMAR